LRTPILIRWDGHTRSASHPQLVSSIDIVPTLLTVAGIETEELKLPGLNLFPSASGESRLPDGRAIFGEIFPGDATRLNHPEEDIAYRWVRRGPLKLIVPQSQRGQPPWNRYLTMPALFDVVRDPDEQNNLIERPSHREAAVELRMLLDEWWSPNPPR
jgi:arylsulfatase A